MTVTVPEGWRREGDEVYYAPPGLTLVDAGTIAILKRLSAGNPRLRCRLCAHRDPQDPVHEMLIVHARECYVRPHLHLGKSESLHVIEGAATLAVFDDDGQPERFEPLGEAGSGRAFYYRMPEGRYHMLLIESDWFVFHEAVQGPFERKKTRLAPWSPEDGDEPSVRRFVEALRDRAVGPKAVAS